MAAPTKSLAMTNRNYSKAQIQAKMEAEAQVAALSTGKPEPFMNFNKEEKKLFERMANIHDSFCEADSVSLTLLTCAMYRSFLINEAMKDLDIEDERTVSLERRALAYDKAIQRHLTALSIPLTSRLRMANDMAKVMIEERKLEQMKSPEFKEVNPLFAVLEAFKS